MQEEAILDVGTWKASLRRWHTNRTEWRERVRLERIWIQGYIAGRENQLQGQGPEMETNVA